MQNSIVSDFPGHHSYTQIDPIYRNKIKVEFPRLAQIDKPRKFRWVKIWGTWTVAKMVSETEFYVIGDAVCVSVNDFEDEPDCLLFGDWIVEPKG